MQEKKAKILVVEDDPFVSSMYVDKLEKAGFETLAADDGSLGWEMIQKEKPDLVLLDILLPKISGFEVLKKMKANRETKDISVILLTNLGQKQDVDEGLRLGAEDYLIKVHFTPQDVMAKIEKVLKEK